MPFALNMPISEFPIPEEGVRIDESYPKFATWVKSNGAQAKDWYKYPKK
jgi:LruC domain-containing protein